MLIGLHDDPVLPQAVPKRRRSSWIADRTGRIL